MWRSSPKLRTWKASLATPWNKRFFKPGAACVPDSVKLALVLLLILSGVGLLAYEWRHAQSVKQHAASPPPPELRYEKTRPRK
jgi:hypothetical protein